jgi:hypothetical protein
MKPEASQDVVAGPCLLPALTFRPAFLRSMLISSSHLHLRLPSVLFPSGFLIKILYAFLISPMEAVMSSGMSVIVYQSTRWSSQKTAIFIVVVLRTLSLYSRAPKLWGAPPGALFILCGGGEARVVCMRNILILNEIWAQDKIYIFVGTLLLWNMKLTLT